MIFSYLKWTRMWIFCTGLFFQNHTGDLDNVPSSVSFWAIRIFTTCKRSLGQGNFLTSVCHSVHRGACVPCMPPATHAPHYAHPRPCIPLCYTWPPCHVCPLPRVPPATHAPSPTRYYETQAVYIILECILVQICLNQQVPSITRMKGAFIVFFVMNPVLSDLAILCRLGL